MQSPTINNGSAVDAFLTKTEAAHLARVSTKTLERLQQSGVDVGLRRVSKRRVVVIQSILVRYLSQLAASTQQQPTTQL